MSAIASQITSLTIVCSTVYLDVDQRKHQNSASLAFVRGIHRRPVNSPHKWPVTRKMFPFDDVIMCYSKWWQMDAFVIMAVLLYAKRTYKSTLILLITENLGMTCNNCHDNFHRIICTCMYEYVLVVISCKFNQNRVFCFSCDIEQNRHKKEIKKNKFVFKWCRCNNSLLNPSSG